jgi:DNA-binding Lrp family transcriptional regulator
MDEKDVRILYAALETKSRSPEEIASVTDIPKSTVHYRLDKLKEDGIVKNDLFEVDMEKLGLSMRAISEVRAVYDEGYHNEVGNQLAAIEGVNEVYFTMGDTDFIVIATVQSREMVEDLISAYESIDSVERTSSKFVIKTVKQSTHPLTDFELETLLGTVNED